MTLRRALSIGVLVLVTWWIYRPAAEGVFVHDDLPAIVVNPNIRSLANGSVLAAMWAPKDVTLSGRPIASLSFALNYALAPSQFRDVMDPAVSTGSPQQRQAFLSNIASYHTTNLAIHMLNGLLLFAIVRRTLATDGLRDRFSGMADGIAAISALIWLVHPVQTNAVTYLVQRVESLMGFFLLATLYFAIRFVTSPDRRVLWATSSVLACALGMATKETMFAAPILVALWCWIFAGPRSLGANRRLLSALAATWVILAALVWTQPRSASVGFTVGGWTPWSYLVTQSAVIVQYLRLCVYPAPLVFIYDWRPESIASVWPQSILVTGLAATTIAGVIRRHPLGFLGAWWFLILAPSSSLLPIVSEVAAEHRLYLPLAAVVTGVVVTGALLIRRLTASSPLRMGIGAALTLLVVVTFGAQTYSRNRDYQSTERLWQDTVWKRAANSQARVLLGAELFRLSRFKDAEAELREAMRLPPPFGAPATWISVAHLYLGATLAAQGHFEEGIRELDTALALNPDATEAYALKATALTDLGRDVQAAAAFRDAVRYQPDNPAVLERAAAFFSTTPNAAVRDEALASRLRLEAARIRGR